MGNYVPQPKSALESQTFAVELGDYEQWQVRLVVRQDMYRGQVRDFAVSLWARNGDDQYEVESVDCCHGQLHRHRLKRSSPRDRQADRVTVRELEKGDEKVVDSEYDVQYDWMVANWESLARRWANG